MSGARKSNKAINQKPKFINILPADVALPILGCALVGILLYAWFSLNVFICIGVSLWLGATYWLYVGDKPWLHLSKITQKSPKWITAQTKYRNRHGNIKIRGKK